MRLPRTTAALLISACIATAGWASTAQTAAATSGGKGPGRGPATTPSASYLFSITAESGSLRRVKGKPDTYALTLRRASDVVTWFTDRPVRDSGFIPTAAFIGSWKAYGFAKVPPNVALTVRDHAGKTDTVVATMTRPSLSHRTFTSTFVVLSMDQAQALDGHLQGHGSRHDLSLPTRFTSAAVFIDDVQGNKPPSCTARTAPPHHRSCM